MLKKQIDNPRYPHTVKIVRMEKSVAVNPFKAGSAEAVVLYEGIGRAYTDTTTVGDERVESNKRKASIPVRYDGWGLENARHVPMSGDEIEVWKGLWHERGIVKDAEPDNDRTIVYWEMIRN